MKKFKKLIPAIALLLISAVLMSTASYAWFSMNTKVTVTGMQVKTKVSSNLAIAGDTLTSTARKTDDSFQSSLSQTVKGYLEPVSTVNGTNFFYTLNAKADGSKESGDYTLYDSTAAATDTTTYANAFSEKYGVTKSAVSAFKGSEGAADAYVDYVFQLKAVATETSFINLEKVFLVDANAKDNSKAHRIAVFVEDITTSNPSGSVGTRQIILTETGAANQTTGEAVSAVDDTDAVTYNAYANTTLATISEAGTKYYKVVVRLWLEGEDTTCYNDKFLALTNAWSIDLVINLNTASTSKTTSISKIWTANVSSTDYWYDGTNVFTSLADAETNSNPVASPSNDVKTAFGIPLS